MGPEWWAWKDLFATRCAGPAWPVVIAYSNSQRTRSAVKVFFLVRAAHEGACEDAAHGSRYHVAGTDMRLNLSLMVVWTLFCATGFCAAGAGTDGTPLIGTWEGESKCAVPSSPCRDEHALYKIFANKKDAARLDVDGYKVVNGQAEFMGRLSCEYRAAQSTLSCTANPAQQDDWEFQISGDTMTGTLTIGPEKTLYRRMSLHKVLTKEH